MIRFLHRISAPVWSISMLLPFALAALYGGVAHACMRVLTIVVIELWYLSAFESFRGVAADYYCSAVSRFRLTVLLMVTLSVAAAVLYILHLFSMVDAEVGGVVSSVSFFILSLVFVWQLVILINVSTFTLDGDEFRRERVKWLMAYLVAPVGVFWVLHKIRDLKK